MSAAKAGTITMQEKLGNAGWEVMRYLTGLPKQQRCERLLFMLQGYFDESGTEGQDSVVVLAGFISTGGKWAQFSDEWDALLKKHGIVTFKMLKASKNHQRLAEFIAVIKRNVLFKIECSISVRDFQSVIKGKYCESNPHARIADSYYFWGFHNLIARLCDGVWHRGYRNPFDVFFDEQLKYGPTAKKFYEMAREVSMPRYKKLLPDEPIFRKDDEFMPLQAADAYAWLVRKHYNGELSQWEWCMKELEAVESIPSPFLDAEILTKEAYTANAEFSAEQIERWGRLFS